MHDFHDKIAEAKARYLDNADGGRVAETRAAYAVPREAVQTSYWSR